MDLISFFLSITRPSFHIVPDPFDHVLVPDLELVALVEEPGQDSLLGMAVDDGACLSS